MSIPLELKPEHGYVIACLFGSFIVNQYMAAGVMGARKKYGVKYPALYATEADSKNYKEFNCVQRGHQNFLENYPTYLIYQVLSAVQYPLASAALGLTFLAGRVLYFKGYASGDPQKRYRGGFQYIGLFGMWGLTGKLAWDLISASLKK